VELRDEKNIKDIVASHDLGFAALTNEGSVIVWNLDKPLQSWMRELQDKLKKNTDALGSHFSTCNIV
jgi:hypothetical protein